jgi:hypothetical protein
VGVGRLVAVFFCVFDTAEASNRSVEPKEEEEKKRIITKGEEGAPS